MEDRVGPGTEWPQLGHCISLADGPQPAPIKTFIAGYHECSLDTRLGALNPKIPKMPTGAYFPGFLEPRKTVEKALVAVI